MLPRKRKDRPTTKSQESVVQKRQRRESDYGMNSESTVVRRYEDEIKRIYSGANVITPAEIASTIRQKHNLHPDVLTPTMVRNKLADMVKKGVLRKRTSGHAGYEQARHFAEQREVGEISESDDVDSGAESQDDEEDEARCKCTNMLMETGELYMTEDPDSNCLFVYIKLCPDAKVDFVKYSKSELEFVIRQAGVASSAIEARFTAEKAAWGPRQLTGVIVPPDGQMFDENTDIDLKVVDLKGRELPKDSSGSECCRWVTVRLKFEQLCEFTAVSGPSSRREPCCESVRMRYHDHPSMQQLMNTHRLWRHEVPGKWMLVHLFVPAWENLNAGSYSKESVCITLKGVVPPDRTISAWGIRAATVQYLTDVMEVIIRPPIGCEFDEHLPVKKKFFSLDGTELHGESKHHGSRIASFKIMFKTNPIAFTLDSDGEESDDEE